MTETPVESASGAVGARVMLAVLCLCWGVTWPIMKIALTEIPPFSFRVCTAVFGTMILSTLVAVQGRSFRVASRRDWLHIAVSSALNVVGFTLFSAFAQLHAMTSRVAIIAYTMPIWTILLARVFLGERLNAARTAGLLLCICGMAILVYPLTGTGVPGGILLALGAAVSWAAGTVYVKWAHIQGDPFGLTAWQVIVALIILALCLPVFEGGLHVSQASWKAIGCMAFTGLIGTGLSYFLWFESVRRLPAMTASLGVLSVPAIGVIASVLIIGDRPTLADIVGFALIFAASACVLLQRPEAPPASADAK